LAADNVALAHRADQSAQFRTRRLHHSRGDCRRRSRLFAGCIGGPDIWIDPGLYGAIFLSDRLVAALAEAGLSKQFDGPLA